MNRGKTGGLRSWGIMLMALAMAACVMVLAPEGARAADKPTIDSDNNRIFANGTAVVIKEDGESTKIYKADELATALFEGQDVSEYIIYGGWLSKEATGNTSVTVESGKLNKIIYGGSNGGSIAGNTNVTVKGGTATSASGGGYRCEIEGSASVEISDGAQVGDAEGGGTSDTITKGTQVVISGAKVSGFVYGGGTLSEVRCGTSVTVTGEETSVGYVYGGGSSGTVTGGTKVEISDGAKVVNTVYGGGYVDKATVSGGTSVIVTGENTSVEDVYGGSNVGNVTGDAKVVISNGAQVTDTVYGGGDLRTSSVNGGTSVTVTGENTSVASVYGGGDTGNVSDDAKVVISDGAKVTSNVYGGGYNSLATVSGGTSVTITGESTSVGGVVRVGGSSGSVGANSSVYLLSGKVGSVQAGTMAEGKTVTGYYLGGADSSAVKSKFNTNHFNDVGGSPNLFQLDGVTLTAGDADYVYDSGKPTNLDVVATLSNLLTITDRISAATMVGEPVSGKSAEEARTFTFNESINIRDIKLNVVGKIGEIPLEFQTAPFGVNNDKEPPEVDKVEPSGPDAAISGDIVITFDEAMNTDVVGSVTLNNGVGALTGSWNDAGNTFTIPYSGLAYGKTYFVNIAAFCDVAGNVMSGVGIAEFTTRTLVSKASITLAAPVRGVASTKATVSQDEERYAHTSTAWTVTGGDPLTPPAPFAASTEYTATVVLTAEKGYQFDELLDKSDITLPGVGTVTEAEVGGDDDKTLTVTIDFPRTATNTASITLAAPVRGVVSTEATVAPGAEYTHTSTAWNVTDSSTTLAVGNPFAASTAYTATVVLAAKDGYTFDDEIGVTMSSSGDAVKSATVSNDGKTLTVVIDFPRTAPTPTPALTVAPTSLTLKPGESEQLKASEAGVTWTSSNDKVATVEVNGMVTAMAEGSATITAAAGGRMASCDVTVEPEPEPAEKFDIGIKVLAVRKGRELILPVLKGYKGSWSVDDKAVAKITAKGKRVKAVGLGEATLTYKVEEVVSKAALVLQDRKLKAGESYAIRFNVRKAGELPTKVTLDAKKLVLNLNENKVVKLTATVKPDKALDKEVFWTSNKPGVVTVDQDGNVTAVAPGTAKITAVSANLKRVTITVTVAGAVTKVTLSAKKKTLAVGETFELIATVNDDALDKTVTWTSGKPGVATVENGVVTALKKGKVKITATATNGKKASCTVTVR